MKPEHDPERLLIRKLVEQFHLSVPERRLLPDGRARLSLVVAAIEEIVLEQGQFPPHVSLEAPFDGPILTDDGAAGFRFTGATRCPLDATRRSAWSVSRSSPPRAVL